MNRAWPLRQAQGKPFGATVHRRGAFKVNINNFEDGSEGQEIDAAIEPINAVIARLLERGVAPADITVDDDTLGWHDGGMPSRLPERCMYPGVLFVAYLGNPAPYSTSDLVQ